MSSGNRWLLPEGIEEILPAEARRLESMRRGLLDLFDSSGYDLVMPPMMEYLDALSTGLGQDLDLQTFKITDQMTGRLMGVRADITPQVARIEAHYLKRTGPVRLCYFGPVLHTRAKEFGGSREPLQLGAELFGEAGPQADAEILGLAVDTLARIGIEQPHLDLGHVGVFRALIAAANIDAKLEAELFDCLQRKARPDIEEVLASADVSDDSKAMFVALMELNGGADVLERAQQVLQPAGADVATALENLREISALLAKLIPSVPLFYDLAEVRGYRYHTGVIFSAFVAGQGQEIASGGRYDDIGADFGYARPATGFSADLRTLLKACPVTTQGDAKGVLVPFTDGPELEVEITRLRNAGERVVRELAGATAEDMRRVCDRRLVRKGKQWHMENLQDPANRAG